MRGLVIGHPPRLLLSSQWLYHMLYMSFRAMFEKPSSVTNNLPSTMLRHWQDSVPDLLVAIQDAAREG
jgi:hypothetical protein